MTYLIHNAIRSVHTRNVRAANPHHKGMKQFLFAGQQRLISARPIALTEEQFQANLAEIQQLVAKGLVRVTLGNLVPFDVTTLTPAVASPAKTQPNFPLDSIARDKNYGMTMDRFEGQPIPDKFEMPVTLPDAAYENPVLEETVADTEVEPAKEHKRRGHRR